MNSCPCCGEASASSLPAETPRRPRTARTSALPRPATSYAESPNGDETHCKVLKVAHSTRPIEAFVELLAGHRSTQVLRREIEVLESRDTLDRSGVRHWTGASTRFASTPFRSGLRSPAHPGDCRAVQSSMWCCRRLCPACAHFLPYRGLWRCGNATSLSYLLELSRTQLFSLQSQVVLLLVQQISAQRNFRAAVKFLSFELACDVMLMSSMVACPDRRYRHTAACRPCPRRSFILSNICHLTFFESRTAKANE